MSTKFTYAVIMTLAQAVFSLLLFFLGYQTDKFAVGQVLQYLSIVISIVVLWLGIKAVREESSDKSLSYGQGVGAGTLISFLSGLMSAVYTYIHFTFINTSYVDYLVDFQKAKMAAKGLTDSQIAAAETVMRKFTTPTVIAITVPIGAVIFGLIISLIIAAILKRAPVISEPPAQA